MIGILQTTRQLLSYLLFATLLLSPAGLFLCLLFPFIKTNNYAFQTWLLLDRLTCTVCHNTKRRTISGWTGQWQNSIKRYYYQAKVINFLIGDKQHCYKAYLWEKSKGYV